MSREELIRNLSAGSEAWNRFRNGHDSALVLHGVSAPRAQLSHANLRKILLVECDMRGSDLSHARLESAVMRKSDLREADFRQANLEGADLFNANLAQADLRDASLAGCFLKRTDLRGADLSTAVGLTQPQISEAIGNDDTILPSSLVRPSTWTCSAA